MQKQFGKQFETDTCSSDRTPPDLRLWPTTCCSMACSPASSTGYTSPCRLICRWRPSATPLAAARRRRRWNRGSSAPCARCAWAASPGWLLGLPTKWWEATSKWSIRKWSWWGSLLPDMGWETYTSRKEELEPHGLVRTWSETATTPSISKSKLYSFRHASIYFLRYLVYI